MGFAMHYRQILKVMGVLSLSLLHTYFATFNPVRSGMGHSDEEFEFKQDRPT